MIVMFFYASGFMMLGTQYILGDVYHVTMRNLDGDAVSSSILETINTDNINSITANIANATSAENSSQDSITNAFQVGYNVAKTYVGAGIEAASLLTGTYIFNIMFLFQVPIIIIAGFVALYMYAVGRTLIAYVRGV